MTTSFRSSIVALALLAGTALPAAAAPQGPPSFILDTEQAYTMTPLAAFAGGGAGAGGGLTIRNGLTPNTEWWLEGTNLTVNPFTFGTALGGKLMFMNNPMAGMAGAVYGSVMPALNAGAFGLGLDAGLAFSQSLVFGNFSFSPNVTVANLTAGPATTLNFNLALIAPLGGGWLVTLQDIPRYGLNGGGFADSFTLGGRFVPAPNTALDVRLLNYDTAGGFTGGLLGVTGYVGW